MSAPRVLVVEDDPPIARLVARTARLEGAEVTMVADGLEARDRWERGSFAVVLLDAMLPGLDGLSLCRERRLAGDRTPVVLITARQVAELGELAREAEVDEVLAKPFAYDDLVSILRRYLRGA
jgi:two-component system, OmpR family, response regulator MprA